MDISIIIPTLNEKKNLKSLLDSIINIESWDKEIFIVDGGSKDGTIEELMHYQKLHNFIKVIDNPLKYVSHGFNLAFKQSNGDFISLIGAHSVYPENYFSKCIEVIKLGLCDVAGGFLEQRGRSSMGMAISNVMSSKFGVGNTHFRTNPKRMYVDSVAFAVYDRKVFEKVGLLDEELVRNQDDEFHYRLNVAGFRILMLPELKVVYYVRESLSQLFKQYFQYGFYKPLVIKKVRKGLKLRHIVPSLFVVYLISLPLFYWFWWWVIPYFIYAVSICFISLRAKVEYAVRFRMILAFPVIHMAYGFGFIKGLILLWKKSN